MSIPAVAPSSIGTTSSGRPSKTGTPIGISNEFAAPNVALDIIV
jgi:hypothetical protein